MAQRILAIFDSADEAQAAARALQRGGLPRTAITIMSSEPAGRSLPDSAGQSKSYIGTVAICGGVLGAAAAVLLTVWTSRGVDLVTGGMPIVTPWAFGIIVFELAALGAMLATLARMIFEAGLARCGTLADYDEAVADGRVVVSLQCVEDTHRDIAEKVFGSNRRLDPPAQSALTQK
jgi:hypothetical protein